MKKILSLMLVGVLCAFSTACSKQNINGSSEKNSDSTDNANVSQAENVTQCEEETNMETTINKNIGEYVNSILDVSKYTDYGDNSYYLNDDDLADYNFDYKITINENDISLPTDYNSFKLLGFTSQDDMDKILDGVTGNSVWNYLDKSYVVLENSLGEVIGCNICNTSEKSQPLSECVLYGICLDYETQAKAPSIKFSNGLTENSSLRDYIKAFGSPTGLKFYSNQITAEFYNKGEPNDSLALRFNIDEIYSEGNNIIHIEYSAPIS